MRQNTYGMHRNFVRHHLAELGAERVDRLTDEAVHAWLAAAGEAGLSIETRRHMLGTIRMILDLGVKERIVPVNVARQVLPPRGPRKEIQFLSKAQAQAFVEASTDERLHALFVLAVTQGLRLGEICGLRWKDVSLERRQLSVRMQLQWTKRGWDLIEPKTRSSKRTIRLTELAVQALKQHRARQAKTRLRAGAEWTDNDLVFCSRYGTFISRTRVVRRAFHRVLAASGCPLDLPFHGLRHTFATLKMEAGESAKVVSEQLGHASVQPTLDLYSHVTPALHEASADLMDRLLASR